MTRPFRVAAVCLSVLLAAHPLLAGSPPRPNPAPANAALTLEEQNVLQGEVLFQQAKEFTRKHDYARAAEKLRQLTALSFPADPPARELMAGAHVSLAEVLLMMQKLTDAEGVAQRGLALTGSDATPTYLRADIYELLGQISSVRGEKTRASQYREHAHRCRTRPRTGW